MDKSKLIFWATAREYLPMNASVCSMYIYTFIYIHSVYNLKYTINFYIYMYIQTQSDVCACVCVWSGLFVVEIQCCTSTRSLFWFRSYIYIIYVYIRRNERRINCMRVAAASKFSGDGGVVCRRSASPLHTHTQIASIMRRRRRRRHLTATTTSWRRRRRPQHQQQRVNRQNTPAQFMWEATTTTCGLPPRARIVHAREPYTSARTRGVLRRRRRCRRRREVVLVVVVVVDLKIQLKIFIAQGETVFFLVLY